MKAPVSPFPERLGTVRWNKALNQSFSKKTETALEDSCCRHFASFHWCGITGACFVNCLFRNQDQTVEGVFEKGKWNLHRIQQYSCKQSRQEVSTLKMPNAFLPLTVSTTGNVTKLLPICMVNRQKKTKDHEENSRKGLPPSVPSLPLLSEAPPMDAHGRSRRLPSCAQHSCCYTTGPPGHTVQSQCQKPHSC